MYVYIFSLMILFKCCGELLFQICQYIDIVGLYTPPPPCYYFCNMLLDMMLQSCVYKYTFRGEILLKVFGNYE